MAVPDFVQTLAEKLDSSATVKRVYGEPVSVNGRTVIPVARIGYGFGGGSGKNAAEHKAEGRQGGGGMGAVPVGIVEISAADTRFIPFTDKTKLAAVLAAGLLLGYLLGRR